MTEPHHPNHVTSTLPAPVEINEARNRRVAWIVTASVLFMLSASYAAVPLYDLFCRTTGYGGTTQVATRAPDKISDRVFTVRFDANVAAGLGWRFEPEVGSVSVRAGEVKTVAYTIRNLRAEPSTGIASYNVTPEQTGGFFNKITCFCFTEQTLGAGETRTEEVVFFVDPDISKDKELNDITTITLSYTFFPAKSATKPLADAGPLAGPGAKAPGSVLK